MSYGFVTDWVINTIRGKYIDDIALVISHPTLQIDDTVKKISYFVPATKKGEELAQTFILEGVGYDIWCVSWERLERFAALEEYNITCLADSEVLYARSEEEKARFETLKRKLEDNLADRHKARMCALQSYEQAKNIYLEMLFASGSDVKLGAGHILDYLARAIAFTNNSYFKRSQTDQWNELHGMENVPEEFLNQYKKTLFEKEEALQKKGCYELICLIRKYLEENKLPGEKKEPCERNYQDLADWYGELSYTWLRIRHYAEMGESTKVYMWGVYLQSELNQVCEDFGMDKMELMVHFDVGNLQALAERADELEQLMRKAITDGGGRIREFAGKEEFLNEI